MVLASDPTKGTVLFNSDGSFTYTPDPDTSGTDQFTYTASDGTIDSNVATVTIEILPVNDPPVAINDAYVTDENSALTVDVSGGVLLNDTDPEDDTLTSVLVDSPAKGSVSLSADGSFTYTPNSGETGTDTFTYRASDATDESNLATVTIQINPANDPPIAVDDQFTTTAGVAVVIPVLANDTDPENDPISPVKINGVDVQSGDSVSVGGGTLLVNSDGTLSFQPASGFSGNVDFDYTISDGALTASASVTGSVTLDHSGVCYPVVGFDRAADGQETTGGMIATDLYAQWGVTISSDNASRPPMLFDSSAPTGGDPDLGTPNQDFGGPGVGSGGTAGAIGENAESLGRVLIISEDGDTSDPDDNAGGGVLTFTFANPTTIHSIGLLDIDDSSNEVRLFDADGNLIATHNASDFGNNSVQRIVMEATGVSRMEVEFVGSGAITDLHFCEDVSSPVSYTLSETIDEATTATLQLTSAESIETLFVDWGDGTIETIANPPAELTHVYDDGNESQDVYFYAETVSGFYTSDGVVTVNNVDPVLTISAPATVDQGASFDLDLSEFDPGEDTIYAWQVDWGDGSPLEWVDGNPTTVTHSYPTVGTFTVTAKAFDEDSPHFGGTVESEGRLIVEAEDFSAAVSGTGNAAGHDWQEVSDGSVSGGSYLIASPNVGRNVGDDTRGPRRDYQVTVDAPGTFYVWARMLGSSGSNDSVHIGVNGTPATYGRYGLTDASGDWVWENRVANRAGTDVVSVTFDSAGTHTINLWMREDGTAVDKIFLTRDPSETPSGFGGAVTTAASGGYVSNSVDVEVLGVNQAPDARNDLYSVNEDSVLTRSVTQGVLNNDSDPEGTPLSLSLVSDVSHGSLSLDADGSFVYTPDADFDGQDSFVYQVSDGDKTDIATVSIQVSPINDAPIAHDDAYSTDEDVSLTIATPGVLANDSDVDDSALDVILMRAPDFGSVTIDDNGSFVYSPQANFHGTDTFLYRLFDGEAYSGIATVTIDVASINDAPIAIDDAYVTDAGVSLTISASDGWLDNDGDPDGDAIVVSTVSQVSPNSAGTINHSNDGSFTFTPAANFDGTVTLDYTISDGILQSAPATVTILVTSSVEFAKFYVADHSSHDVFVYDDGGGYVENWDYDASNRARGATANAAGDTLWTVTAGHDVVVYSPDGAQLGKWQARTTGNSSGNLHAAEGVATDGTNIWIVDRAKDKVLFYAGGASHLSGDINATSEFDLHTSNRNPSGIATDGTNLYVLEDDSRSPRVFVYNSAGQHLGNWELDLGNGKHDLQGITTNPTGGTELWVVDKKTDRVYYFPSGTDHRSGERAYADSFDLHADNKNPYGIADPPPTEPALKEWVADTGGNWNDPANWEDGTLPTASDDVLIDIPTGEFTITVNSSGVVVNSLQTSEEVVVGSSGDLTLNATSEIASLQISNGELLGSGDVTVTDEFLWTGGSLLGSGQLILESTISGNGFIGEISGSSSKTLARTLVNRESITWSGGNLNIGTTPYDSQPNLVGTLVNQAGATLDIQTDRSIQDGASYYGYSSGVSPNSIVNNGVITKSGTSTTDIAVPLTGAGNFDVQSGTLSLTQASSLSGDPVSYTHLTLPTKRIV